MEEQHLPQQSEDILPTFNLEKASGETKVAMPTIESVSTTALIHKESELQMGSLNLDSPPEYNAELAENIVSHNVKEMNEIGNQRDKEDDPARNSVFLNVKEMKKIANQANLEDTAIALPPETQEPLKVVMSTSFKEGNDKYIKQYYSRGPKRGLIVIFMYSKFLTGPEYRDVERDCVLLEKLFKAINFDVIIHGNLTKEETEFEMKKHVTEGYDCCFFVVSSHGFDRKGLWDTEFHCHLGEMSTYEVVELFSNENRPELRGIPKVFVFQMCRGRKQLSELENASKDAAISVGNDSNTGGSSTDTDRRKSSDILIAYSTLPGHESILNEKGVPGSLYMQALCEVFGSLAHERHVLDLFRILDARFKELCPAATTSVDCWGFADLYLNPGLKEDADGNPTPM